MAKGKAKGVVIGARFSPEEAKRVHDAIDVAGQKKPDWVRAVLLQAAKSPKQNPKEKGDT